MMTSLNLAKVNTVLVAVLISFVNSCPKCPGIPKCDQIPQGPTFLKTTFDQTDGRQIHSGCNIPNPREKPSACGLDKPGWLCDPDSIISQAEVTNVNQILEESYNSSYCRCGNACGPYYRGNPIMVALVAHPRYPDLSGQKCKGVVNGCYDVYPQHHPTDGQPAPSEINKAYASFLYGLITRWNQYKCEDYIFIIYFKDQMKFAAEVGMKLGIRESFVDTTMDDAHSILQEKNVEAALIYIIQQFSRQVMHRDNTALIVGITIASIIGVLILFGILSSVLFCFCERKRGKTCDQICYGMAGGYWAFLLGGDRHDPVPPERQPMQPVVTA